MSPHCTHTARPPRIAAGTRLIGSASGRPDLAQSRLRAAQFLSSLRLRLEEFVVRGHKNRCGNGAHSNCGVVRPPRPSTPATTAHSHRQTRDITRRSRHNNSACAGAGPAPTLPPHAQLPKSN
ncbi:hypothetical protein J6590_058344 [Homalodisca vitripennis]|nr:hypothetical protein J6590_058344 [Homalodisca vitripennis]